MNHLLNRLLVTGLLVVTQAWADSPNYDTNSGIVSFPRVTVNDKDRYINVDLLLNPNGTWKILDYEPEPLLDLTGDWHGEILYKEMLFEGLIVDCIASTKVTLIHSGNSLTGTGSLGGDCIDTTTGKLTGLVNDHQVSFDVELDIGLIHYQGKIADNHQSLDLILTGPITFNNKENQTTWSLTRQ